ncbi:hypothetical protein INT43_006858 [Umbelopsis isabellina]|uniref:Transcription initiation factor IIF subunit alpha n=1 Tax=Mortierella isabellina TaxID=91625 RepID=A0A8H7PY35_MORIS|nr:hypothetical protein INT43_006858 [Umbelopsis isabellina]
MSSIYRTNNANRGSPRPAGRGRGVPGRPRPVNAMGHKLGGPGGPAQPLPPITSQDFPLMSSSKVESHNIMNFKTVKPVKLENFTPPVKLQRKDPNAPPPAPANDPGAGPEAMNEEPSRGPKTGADTSLIAPMGGATRNKQMLFKKRTRQIFLAKEDTRKLREQEQKPWVLEDFDNQNSFVGSLEGGQQSDYMLFVFAENGFKVVPVDKWYKFNPKISYQVMSLDEAEEHLQRQQKTESSRWLTARRPKEEAEGEQAGPSQRDRFRVVDNGTAAVKSEDEDDAGGKRRGRNDSDIDDIDFDEVFQDDEEVAADMEAEDDETKDVKARVKRETKGYVPGGENVEDFDEEDISLTSEGKQMRKLVRNLEKNNVYESDEDHDPYASSAGDLGSSDDEEDSGKSDSEAKKNDIKATPKKLATPTKPTLAQKKALMANRKPLSKPIGRPHSPSLHNVKRERGVSSTSSSRASSPVHRGSLSPMHPSSPSDSTGAGAKKRMSSEISDGETESKRMRKAAGSASPPHRAVSPTNAPVDGSADGGDIISEAEVVAALRGRKLTTKEFLSVFRKRLKKDRNKDIITGLLKKVARHVDSPNPKEKLLELKPEYQT